jgi:hypothetical protein
MRIFPQTPAFFFGVFDTHTREATAKMIPSAHVCSLLRWREGVGGRGEGEGEEHRRVGVCL